jgi:hypothetical protein
MVRSALALAIALISHDFFMLDNNPTAPGMQVHFPAVIPLRLWRG